MLIAPFRALRPTPEQAAAVAAPPYDVVNEAEARQRAAGRPWSFLHISRPEIDLPEGGDPYAPAVYAKGAENLRRMVDAGVLLRDERPCYYIYRLRADGHVQTGVAAAASIAAYDAGRIRKHELTRRPKEQDRVRQIDALNAQTGPVLLAYRNSVAIGALIAEVVQEAPLYDLTADDGVLHTLWRVDDAPRIARLSAAFEALEALYIADGHHRSAAASRVAAARTQSDSGRFLAVAFPHDEVRILGYHRVVRDLNGLSAEAFVARVAERFEIAAAAAPVAPERSGQFGMYLAGQWRRLTLPAGSIPRNDPVARMDAALLQQRLIAPILGVADLRGDPRIDFVGGVRGLEALQARVDSGEMAVAFALYPASMAELMAVADADASAAMTPKFSWFEPKLVDGLLSLVLD